MRRGYPCRGFAVAAPIEQDEIVGAHEPGRDGVLDEPRTAVRRELAPAAAQPVDADLVELLADVVELAVEGGHAPPESRGRLGRLGTAARPAVGCDEHVLGERDHEQPLARGEGDGQDGGAAVGGLRGERRVVEVLLGVHGEVVRRRIRR